MLYALIIAENVRFLLVRNTLLVLTWIRRLTSRHFTILAETSLDHDGETGGADLDAFKIAYIAPVKALVQEIVGNFSSRLGVYGTKVGELTGDSKMTKQQILQT